MLRLAFVGLLLIQCWFVETSNDTHHHVVHDSVRPPLKKDQRAPITTSLTTLPEWEKDVELDGRIRYIEMLLAVDAGISRFYGFDMQKIRKAMVMLMHGYLYQLDLRITIVDVVYMPSNNASLEQFLQWRADETEKFPIHDVAVLIRHRYEGGIAYVGGVCKRTSVGISGFFPEAPMEYASVFFHELSHLLGVQHEARAKCHCDPARRDNCLRIDGFDNECSVQALVDGLRDHECIQEAPAELASTTVPICGNGIVEEGEQCDCGPQRYCRSWLCEPRTCTRVVPNFVTVTALATIFSLALCCCCALIRRAFKQETKKPPKKTSTVFSMTHEKDGTGHHPEMRRMDSRSGDSLLPLQLPQIEPKKRILGLEIHVPVPEIINSPGYVPMNVVEPPKRPLASPALPSLPSMPSHEAKSQTSLRLPKIPGSNGPVGTLNMGSRPEISAPIAHIVASKPVWEFESEGKLLNAKTSLCALPPPPIVTPRRVYPEVPDRTRKPQINGMFSPSNTQTLPPPPPRKPSGNLEPIYDVPPVVNRENGHVHAMINRLQGTL